MLILTHVGRKSCIKCASAALNTGIYHKRSRKCLTQNSDLDLANKIAFLSSHKSKIERRRLNDKTNLFYHDLRFVFDKVKLKKL
jgi:hypothetical protein